MIKLGLALGSGGARGLAHEGVLSVLEQEGLRVRELAGMDPVDGLGTAFPGRALIAEPTVAGPADSTENRKDQEDRDHGASLSGVRTNGCRSYSILPSRTTSAAFWER